MSFLVISIQCWYHPEMFCSRCGRGVWYHRKNNVEQTKHTHVHISDKGWTNCSKTSTSSIKYSRTTFYACAPDIYGWCWTLINSHTDFESIKYAEVRKRSKCKIGVCPPKVKTLFGGKRGIVVALAHAYRKKTHIHSITKWACGGSPRWMRAQTWANISRNYYKKQIFSPSAL